MLMTSFLFLFVHVTENVCAAAQLIRNSTVRIFGSAAIQERDLIGITALLYAGTATRFGSTKRITNIRISCSIGSGKLNTVY